MLHRLQAVLAAALAAITTLPAQAQAPAAAPAASAPAAAPPAAAPSALRPFRDLVRDAKELPGVFTLYQRDERLWLAVRPDQLGRLFFFSFNIPNSVGERGLYGSQMGRSWLVEWRRIGNQLQLVARNTEFFAAPGTPQAQMVAQSFSDSLLASAPVLSAPHPESKAFLVDAAALFMTDIPGYQTRLESAFRLPFALDVRNSSFARVRNSAELTGIHVNAHFSVARLPAPPSPAAATPSTTTAPTPPAATPDARSLFVGFYFNLAELPRQPMRGRVADERIGHFVSSRIDFSDDTPLKRRTHYVKRWRLEKADPAAPLSEPKQAIVYWLDKAIPLKYRQAVSEGVLEWNKAFERIGFSNAIVVRQQGDADSFDTMDARHASIRWFTGADGGFAIGPSHMDPRSGEILDADIATGDGFTRLGRRLAREEAGRELRFAEPYAGAAELLVCDTAEHSAHDFQYAMELLEARGVAPDSPVAEALAQASIRRNVMHEVGHTLGLRHNFRGSSIYSLEQLEDPAFTRANGMAGSIMEYLAFNVAPRSARQGDYINTTLGPYDHWAIEYAYREIAPQDEAAELARIAARSSEPLLAYGTDDDAGSGAPGSGMDPEVNRFDIGANPLAWYQRRMALNRELWERAQSRQLGPDESHERSALTLQYGFAELARVAPLAAKYVGGVTHLRDRAGSGRPIFSPVPAARQREALAVLTRDLFEATSFRFKPEFLSRISGDRLEPTAAADFSVASAVLAIQSSVLDRLMSEPVAARLLNAEEMVADGSRLLKLSEMHGLLQAAIWAELKAGSDIRLLRRNLKSEHLKRLVAALLRPSPRAPADVAAVLREQATKLAAQIKAAKTAAMSSEARAHLAESFHLLTEALRAPLQRAAP